MKDTQITVRISEAEKELIKALAAKRDIPASQLIREVLREYLNKERD